MKAELKATIFEKDGKVIEDRGFEEAHSFVFNFVKILFILLSQISTYLTNTNNAFAAASAASTLLAVQPADNVTYYGIQIGSGTTSPAMTDATLTTQIVTNVHHNLVNLFLNCPNSNTMEIIISRTFMNNTGSTLTINEVGLISYMNASYGYLLDHTLYTAVVPIAGAITLTYKFTISL
jgi:hypothetical protein